ncbi:MAG: 2-C-methyl-D-erythritol 2,4-cyclodiphosphate synthase [Spirochaetaceae bacterium]|jgi:2-C-methyl-D-erythritol 2,4-cyclodiphosphate synthase|nr:2-C-methyl-D-erythritol 2,4-cyclodiphosphate synthase [Spirochaetaceae bacterium]
METRVGLGRDLHKLVEGRRFILGGVEIPFYKGESGHSDGDVLTHAIIDALLGAAALGDIGELFPPDDALWKDADSINLLKIAYHRVSNAGWRLVNIDCVVNCEKPKILPYRDAIRTRLGKALSLECLSGIGDPPPPEIFIKGKTGEGLGDIGKSRAVEALAVCLLEKE